MYERPLSIVDSVALIGAEGLKSLLANLSTPLEQNPINAEDWNNSPYRPVPAMIEAATNIFSGHNVRSIANADADNLRRAAARLIALIAEAHTHKKRYLLILTGVPGSGKTLAGLDVVHSSLTTGVEREGDIIYLSRNTPLVVVLREALARDEYARARASGANRSMAEIRRAVRARIQHINDFLQQSLEGPQEFPPHEHVIVFDEAQRAWDEKHGFDKFERSASEPALLLELMSRHTEWCVCVCLVGVGQEINSGEEGLLGWGDALRKMPPEKRSTWRLFAGKNVSGADSNGSSRLGELPSDLPIRVETDLELFVPQRSFRSPKLSSWVDLVLAGELSEARVISEELRDYPIVITRSLTKAKLWLRAVGRGERRYGLLASSGARRLRAEGLGTTLNATSGDEIAHWYLNPIGDIRSSYALEVPANEYTCQGLELDFACLCWGGDLLWERSSAAWKISRLLGTVWQNVRARDTRQFALNSYRVLLTRAREGIVLWVPEGDSSDSTRSPMELDATASFLADCGGRPIL